ncbi:MAG: carbamoyl-phosphate synthase small subunit, partial [Gammaproteobacteria bacterium]|nr:carbamoyl-phosphate synthase small subunit [Gammaproteobacteria bacterium]
MPKPAILALEDGTLFEGMSIGIDGLTAGEVVFNTAMTGYQEILTDPSYCQQLITLTYPHIGNTGVNIEDEEARDIHASGLIIRDLPLLESNWRSESNLGDYLNRRNVVAIADIDTRKLTRLLRDKGAQSGAIMAGDGADADTALAAARDFCGLAGTDLAQVVSTKQDYNWTKSVWNLENGYSQHSDGRYHIVAYDFGVKKNILCMLAARGARVTVVPAKTPASDV